MMKIILKVLSVLLLVVLSILIFVKLLPWALALTAIAAFAKLGHDWLVRQGFIAPSAWGPWQKPDGPQQAPPPPPQ